MDFQYAILDIDDVLLTTQQAEPAAARALLIVLSEHLGSEKAEAVHREFVGYWRTLQRQHWGCGNTVDDDYSVLQRRIAAWQRGVVEQGYEVKPWSRQALLACALESQQVEASEGVIRDVTEAYWQEMARSATVHTDATVALGRLQSVGCHFHLATDSDGFLSFDESKGTFVYDPEISTQGKIRRLRALWRLGVNPRDVTVGDPIGKPKLEFSRRTIAEFSEKIGHDIDISRTVVVGDSLSRDIEPFLRVGVATGVWLVRERSGGEAPRCPHPNVAVVDSLLGSWHTAGGAGR